MLIGVVAAALALVVAVFFGLWWYLAPTPRPGEKEIQRLGCDSLSSVGELAARPGADASAPRTSIMCRVDESATPPTCAAVLAAYEAAPGHREGNALVVVNQAKTVGGRGIYAVACRQLLAQDGSVVPSF